MTASVDNVAAPDDDTERLTIAELITAIRRFGVVDRIPLVVSVAVAPDVWAFLREHVPIVRGSSLTTMGITVFSSATLPRGAVVPLDENGKPIPKRKASDPQPVLVGDDGERWYLKDEGKPIAPFVTFGDLSRAGEIFDFSNIPAKVGVMTPESLRDAFDRAREPMPLFPTQYLRAPTAAERKPPVSFKVPGGTPLTRCVSCHAPIFWIVTDGGKRMPVDAESHESHFATCPHAAEHRKPRKKKR